MGCTYFEKSMLKQTTFACRSIIIIMLMSSPVDHRRDARGLHVLHSKIPDSIRKFLSKGAASQTRGSSF
jgi:hypothetical protein